MGSKASDYAPAVKTGPGWTTPLMLGFGVAAGDSLLLLCPEVGLDDKPVHGEVEHQGSRGGVEDGAGQQLVSQVDGEEVGLTGSVQPGSTADMAAWRGHAAPPEDPHIGSPTTRVVPFLEWPMSSAMWTLDPGESRDLEPMQAVQDLEELGEGHGGVCGTEANQLRWKRRGQGRARQAQQRGSGVQQASAELRCMGVLPRIGLVI